jgi:hypothetical protein
VRTNKISRRAHHGLQERESLIFITNYPENPADVLQYQYSVTLPIYGLTPGEKIVFNSLVILSISLFLRLALVFLAAGINALIALPQD